VIHDNPYDAADEAWRDEDLRQALADQADEEYNDRRQLGQADDLTCDATKGE
jgi:hypothetical protein